MFGIVLIKNKMMMSKELVNYWLIKMVLDYE